MLRHLKPPAPDLSGWHGVAWKLKTDMPAPARVAAWIINAPWAHPFWANYLLSATHLREHEGLRPPIIHLAGATHELLLHAIDPDWQIKPNQLPQMLHPANFAAQFIAPSDEAAAQRLLETVEEILAGKLSPDTDYTQSWIARWGSNMIKGDPAAAGETKIKIATPAGKPVINITIHPKGADETPDINTRN